MTMEDFLVLFPRAVKSNQFNSKLLPTYRPRVKKYEPVMIGGQEYVPCEETKFCTTTRLYTYKVKNIRELDGLFGDSTLFSDHGWDLVFNDKSVGYVTRLEFLLVKTTV